MTGLSLRSTTLNQAGLKSCATVGRTKVLRYMCGSTAAVGAVFRPAVHPGVAQVFRPALKPGLNSCAQTTGRISGRSDQEDREDDVKTRGTAGWASVDNEGNEERDQSNVRHTNGR